MFSNKTLQNSKTLDYTHVSGLTSKYELQFDKNVIKIPNDTIDSSYLILMRYREYNAEMYKVSYILV